MIVPIRATNVRVIVDVMLMEIAFHLVNAVAEKVIPWYVHPKNHVVEDVLQITNALPIPVVVVMKILQSTAHVVIHVEIPLYVQRKPVKTGAVKNVTQQIVLKKTVSECVMVEVVME